MTKIEISVVIPTLDRPTKIVRAVNSVLQSAKNFGGCGELLVVDQSEKPVDLSNSCRLLRFPIRHIHHAGIGVSRARNLGIFLAQQEFVAFIDDDCLVDPKWLSELTHILESTSERVIFGKTEAFPPPLFSYSHEVSRGRFGLDWHGIAENGDRCFATILRQDREVFLKPCLPYAEFGSSNNFVIKKKVILDHGHFSPFFGAGALGRSAEDTEWQYRLLRRGEPIAYEPCLKVMHDNWLSHEAALQQICQYTMGTLALFLGHSLGGDWLACQYFMNIIATNCLGQGMKRGGKLRVRAFGVGCRNGLRMSGHLRRLVNSPLSELKHLVLPEEEKTEKLL